MFMEAKLGISLYSYLYFKLAKTLYLCYYVYVFSSIKSENKRTEQFLPGSRGGGWPKQCIHIVNVKTIKKNIKQQKHNFFTYLIIQSNFAYSILLSLYHISDPSRL
jgi:hypothetical protein